MKLAIVAAGLVLAGCASPEQLRASVGGASNFQLCRAVMLAPSNVAGIAREEAGRRRLDCGPYAAGVLQNEQANDAATNAYVQRLLTPAPMPAPPRTTNCTSRRTSNNTVVTDCW